MKYRHLFYLYAFILILCVSHVLRGEEHENTSATATNRTRPPAETNLDDKMVGLLTRLINPSQTYIRGKFSLALPEALEKALQQKDEDSVAKIMAEFMGQINPRRNLQEVNEAKQMPLALVIPTEVDLC